MSNVPEVDTGNAAVGTIASTPLGMEPANSWYPKRPRSFDEAGLSHALVRDLTLKTVYTGAPIAGFEMARRLRLDYEVLEGGVKDLVTEGLIQSAGEARHKPAKLDRVEEGLMYAITDPGRQRAREAIDRCAYVGPAPVPLAQYNLAVIRQGLPDGFATKERVSDSLAHLVLPEQTLKLLGPALNSRKSIFLYGHSGNGKSSIARATRFLLGSGMYIPNALAVDDEIIRLMDPGFHEPSREPPDHRADARWSRCARPFVQVGGELDISMLDLIYHPSSKFYDAPLQMKANCGIFLVDDFGRQVIEPRSLLNRFVVPLEENVDYLNMSASGRKIDIPFNMLLILSTNLQPSQLMDEAFIRRIRHKIKIPDPTEEAFREIFRREADQQGVAFHPSALDYILETYYRHAQRPMRGVHPRDILMHVREIASYEGSEPIVLDQAIVDDACSAQFVGDLEE
ncbi:MAG: ATP-binding protein [Candidatus Dormibacteraeota bacterium]|nr:ATP-binding protein [Candidatus Dormibacteraeota bacterium]